jgi:hypothetical protein
LGSIIFIVFETGWVKLGILFYDGIPVIVLVVLLVDWGIRISKGYGKMVMKVIFEIELMKLRPVGFSYLC